MRLEAPFAGGRAAGSMRGNRLELPPGAPCVARRRRGSRVRHSPTLAAGAGTAAGAGRLGPAPASHPLDPSPRPAGATTCERRGGAGMREDTDEPLPSESEKTTWLAMAAGERGRQAGAAGRAGAEGAAGGGVGGRALSLSLSPWCGFCTANFIAARAAVEADDHPLAWSRRFSIREPRRPKSTSSHHRARRPAATSHHRHGGERCPKAQIGPCRPEPPPLRQAPARAAAAPLVHRPHAAGETTPEHHGPPWTSTQQIGGEPSLPRPRPHDARP
jgi:hypothetical protein